MTTPERTIHEPDAELLNAEEAIEDGERLRMLFSRGQKIERAVELHIPLSVLLDAIDHLDVEALQTIAQRAEERLAGIHDET